jgi:hypothetical protein
MGADALQRPGRAQGVGTQVSGPEQKFRQRADGYGMELGQNGLLVEGNSAFFLENGVPRMAEGYRIFWPSRKWVLANDKKFGKNITVMKCFAWILLLP